MQERYLTMIQFQNIFNINSDRIRIWICRGEFAQWVDYSYPVKFLICDESVKALRRYLLKLTHCKNGDKYKFLEKFDAGLEKMYKNEELRQEKAKLLRRKF